MLLRKSLAAVVLVGLLLIVLPVSPVMASDSYDWEVQAAPVGVWRSVVWSPELELYSAVGLGSVVGENATMTSPDGFEWTAQSAPGGQWISHVWVAELGRFIVLGENQDEFMGSSDGVNWNVITVPDAHWMDLAWSANLERLVAVAAESTDNVMTSSDGENWTTFTAPHEARSVTWSPALEIFVSVGSAPSTDKVMVSSDGQNWTAHSIGGDMSGRDVAWSPELELFVLVGDKNRDDVIATSVNGEDWVVRAHTFEEGGFAVTWDSVNERFLVYASETSTDLMMVSSDGVVWENMTVPSAEWGSLGVSEDRFQVVGVSAISCWNEGPPCAMTSTNEAPAVSVSVEDESDGSGDVVPGQTIASGDAITVYSINRTDDDQFIDNSEASWSLVEKTGGVVAGDLVAAGDNRSATFTCELVGTAVIKAEVSGLDSVTSGTIECVAGDPSEVQVETLADGSGSVVSAQSVQSGDLITAFSVSRDDAGNFIENVVADGWSLVNTSGGVDAGDLVADASEQSAVFTGELVGEGKIRATVSGLTSVDSGLIEVTVGPADVIRVEDEADGTGSLVSSQEIAAGDNITVYSIVRDAAGNFIDNEPGDWSLSGIVGGVDNSSLAPSEDERNALFSCALVGEAVIVAEKDSLDADSSGTLTCVPGDPYVVQVETERDGGGEVVPAQSLRSLDDLTVHSVVRDEYGNFIENGEADFWNLTSVAGDVQEDDLHASDDSRSALFECLLGGNARINATIVGLNEVGSGTIICRPPPKEVELGQVQVNLTGADLQDSTFMGMKLGETSTLNVMMIVAMGLVGTGVWWWARKRLPIQGVGIGIIGLAFFMSLFFTGQWAGMVVVTVIMFAIMAVLTVMTYIDCKGSDFDLDENEDAW